VASDQFSRLESEHKQQTEELEQLRQENARLQETVALYESKMQEATAKIDGIFDQLSEL
jgi:predicted nuclease with TOPRIM domain